MNGLDIGVFVAFVACVIGIGLWKSKGEKTHSENGAADYFLAGRGLSWWLVGFSLIAANISTEQFVGMSGKAADWLGMAIASYEWMAAITLVVVAFVFLPKFLKCGIYTIPEFLEYRYSWVARTVMAVATMVILVGVPTAAVIYSGAKVITVFFTNDLGQQMISITLACWIIGSLAAIYVFAGGLKACAWADLIQGSALIVGGAIIAYLVWTKLGNADVGALTASIPNLDLNTLKEATALERFQMLNPHKLTMFKPTADPEIPWTALVVGLWIPNFFYWGLNQYIMQRSLGSKSLGEGQKGIIFAAMLKLVIPFVVVIPGILAFNLFSKDLATSAFNSATQVYEAAIKHDKKEVYEFTDEFNKEHHELAAKVLLNNAKVAGSTPSAEGKTMTQVNDEIIAVAKEKKISIGKKMVGYDTDAAFPTLLKIVPKGGLLGFVLAALFGAVVSSLASMLNSASTIAAMDLFHKLKKDASQFMLVSVGRVCTILFVIIAMLIAPTLDDPSWGGIFTFIQEFQGFLSPGILGIFIFGLLIRRAPRMLGTIGILFNIALYGALKFFYSEIAFLNRMAICLGAVLFVLTIITIIKPLTKPIELPVNDKMDMKPSKLALIGGIIVVIATIALYVIFSNCGACGQCPLCLIPQ